MALNKKTTKQGHKPKKYLGQNFLIDKNILKKIVQTADLKKSDYVLEVGPGQGCLTQELALRTNQVLAVEKDKDLIADLTNQGWANVQVVQADVLCLTDETLRQYLRGQKYRVIANLPYNISSEFIKLFLEREYAPTSMILMLQKEVAERICAKNGENSVLSLSVQFYCEPEIKFFVKKNSFKPIPKVDSAIIEFRNIHKNKSAVEPKRFFQLIKKAFGQKRKQLKNNLKDYGHKKVQEKLADLGYDGSTRAEELTFLDWVKLAQVL